MRKLQQRNLDQTGVALLKINDTEKEIPLYSLEPVQEAQEIVKNYFPDCHEISAVYVTNNLMTTKIEDIISQYEKDHLDLPEDMVNELVSGFPNIIGLEPQNTKAYYL